MHATRHVALLWILGAFVTSRCIGVSVCDNGGGVCPRNTTCCENEDGSQGCCPSDSAVCCPDKIHCCPQGSTCDLQVKQCRGGAGPAKTVPLMRKLEAVRLPRGFIVCPDQHSSCPEFYTCCPGQVGYQCCPAPHAQCCPDKHHCCPHGSVCDSRHGRCDRGNKVTVPWFSKVPARPISFGQVVCPGGQYQCPTGASCCRLKSGDWGCCPIPRAVCCEDGDHCCPQGYTCNLKMGTCQKEDIETQFVRWINITDKNGQPPVPPNTICPSGKFKCPSEQTCCSRKGGSYGCCPFVKAVCCSDEKHCCPVGYQCDLDKSTCVKGKASTMLLSTLRAALDVRVPTSYQQLQNMLNTGYLPAQAKTKSPVLRKLVNLNSSGKGQQPTVAAASKQQQPQFKATVSQTGKVQATKLQPKQAQAPKLQPKQAQALKLQSKQTRAQVQPQKKAVQANQQATLTIKSVKPSLQRQQLQANQNPQQKPVVKPTVQPQPRQSAVKPNVQLRQQQQQKPVVKPKVLPQQKQQINKPVVQQANKIPHGQHTKPYTNQAKRVDLKKIDPKIAEASRRAKIAMAVKKNAQVLRKLQSIQLNEGEVLLPNQVKLQPKVKVNLPKIQSKPSPKPVIPQQAKHVPSHQSTMKQAKQPALTPEQVKVLQQQQVKNLHRNKPVSQQGSNKPQIVPKASQVKPNAAAQKRH